MTTKVKPKKVPQCPIQTRLIEYVKKGHDVTPIRSNKLWTHIAFNTKPPQLDIWLAGPDDIGRCKDIHIDLRSLLSELRRTKVI